MLSPKGYISELPYWGTIQFYTKHLLYKTVCIEQFENYRKGSFRNRTSIATANGVLALSIPLAKGKHQQTSIKAVEIDNSLNWQLQHWRSIKTAYGNSPYFEYYGEDIKALYEKKYDLLFDFCLEAHNLMLELLNLPAELTFTESFQKVVDSQYIDARNAILPKNYTKMLDIHFNPIAYPQVFEDRHGFLPNLSILDLLFCAGPEAISYLQMSIVQ
jgi:hypothetical protein